MNISQSKLRSEKFDNDEDEDDDDDDDDNNNNNNNKCSSVTTLPPPPPLSLALSLSLDVITSNFRKFNVTRAGTLGAPVNDARTRYFCYILNYTNKYYKYSLFRYVNGEKKIKS